MAIQNPLGSVPTLLSSAQSMMNTPGMRQAGVTAYLLARSHEFLANIPLREAGPDNTVQVRQQTALPQSEISVLNQGVTPSQGGYQNIIFGLAEARSLFKCPMALLEGRFSEKKAQFLWDENVAFTQQLGNDIEEYIIYGGTYANGSLVPIKAFEQVYNSTSGTISQNMLSFSGATALDQTSVFLMDYSSGGGVYLIHGHGSPAGIAKKVRQSVGFANGSTTKEDEFHYEFYSQSIGVVHRDWRRVVRGYNVDRPMLRARSYTALTLGTKMMDMITKLEYHTDPFNGATSFFVPVRFLGALRVEFYKTAFGSGGGAGGTMSDTNQMPQVMMVHGIPVRVVRTMDLNKEAVLT